MASDDIHNVEQTILEWSVPQRLHLIEAIVRSLKRHDESRRQVDEEGLAEQQRIAIRRLQRQLGVISVGSPDDGLSGSEDHDTILYGKP